MPNFEPSEEMLKLKATFEEMDPGSFVTYADLEKKSTVKMNNRGKSLMRSALRSLGIEYRADRGNGIELESPNNCMHLVSGRVRRVSKSLKRADKTTTRMTARYIDELPKPDQQRLIATASLFAAIHGMAKGLSEIYKPGVPPLNTIQNSIPKPWSKKNPDKK